MRLIINRSQQDIKGRMGAHKGVQFNLRYRLELTTEERDLVRRYKLDGYPITTRTFQGTTIPGETISSLLQGPSRTVTDVTTLIGLEEIIKDACDQLPVLFRICRSFGGDEVIEYPRDGGDKAEVR